MRISKRDLWGAAVLALTMIAAVGLDRQFAGGPPQGSAERPISFATKEQAFRAGIEALAADNMSEALPALHYAADRGVLGAQLRLAQIYSGDSARGNDAKALTYYHMIVNQHGDIDRLHPAAQQISEAFRGLARFYQTGISEIGLKRDPGKAAQLMRHAASYFRDPKAQFALGKMYAEGDGVARNQRLALGWLLKASQKRHARAQAYLGEMLWRADTDKLMRARGLALLALAVNNAGDKERSGIEARYKEAGRTAKAAEIERAERFVAAWHHLRARGTSDEATAHLRALRSTSLENAPVGSLVVSVNDDPFAAQEQDGLSGSIIADLGLHLPYDVVATDLTGESPASVTEVHPAEKFFRDHLSGQADAPDSDVFDTVEVDRYSGRLLSVEADAPAK